MPEAIKDRIDKLINLSGGSYVSLATMTVLGLAIAEFISGHPFAVTENGREVTYIVHTAPEWFVSAVGVYTIILGVFALSKPVNTYVNSKAGATPTEPTPTPTTIPLQK